MSEQKEGRGGDSVNCFFRKIPILLNLTMFHCGTWKNFAFIDRKSNSSSGSGTPHLTRIPQVVLGTLGLEGSSIMAYNSKIINFYEKILV